MSDLLKLADQCGAFVEYESESDNMLRVTFAPGHWENFAAALASQPVATQYVCPQCGPTNQTADEHADSHHTWHGADDSDSNSTDAARYRFLEYQCRTGTYRGIISRKAIDEAMSIDRRAAATQGDKEQA
jgi:hypothetical protein